VQEIRYNRARVAPHDRRRAAPAITEEEMKKELKLGTYLMPMPTILVGAMVDGKPNYMVAAYVGIMNFRPPMISAGLNKGHHTSSGIVENKAFSINIPPAGLVVETDYCGLVSGKKTDKSSLFTPFFGKLQTAPMITECPLNLEVKLTQTIEFAVDIAFIGEIVSIFCDDACLTDGLPDIKKVDPIVFAMGQNHYYCVGDFIGKAWSVGNELKPKG
jgi:flavin reductase (DIM6/NTAB) family NADH-FMN oxidoreductase RutF